MKIAFLTSSLEPGRDGVGDYVRMLAAEFTRRGHPSVVLALNDRLCSAIVESGNELRLPESAPWSERSAAAKRLLRAFGPDWISLHFVAFGYNARGVPLQWPGRFQELCGGACVHLMFHELWLGLAAEASTKHKLIGALQRHCFSKMVQKLQPKFVTTSNRAYAALLGTIGVAASVLPMFGAIPLEDVSENGCSEVSSDSSRLNVVIFGSLHPEWPPEPLLTHLRGAAAKLQRKLAFISVGNIGPGETLWQSMVSRYSDMEFLRLGPRSTAEIAACFQKCHFGISTTPLEILGKSASVAAMLEHGLPVIVNRIEPQIQKTVKFDLETDPQVLPIDDTLPERMIELPRWPKTSRMKPAADTLIAEMEQHAR